MELQVIGKKLISQPIKNDLIQGEANIERYSINIPRMYGNVDLSGFSFKMRGASAKDTIAEQVLSKTVTDNSIILLWNVTGDFTAVDGALSLELAGISSDGEEIIKFTSEDINIRKNLIGNYAPPADVIEQALAQMQLEIVRAAAEADRASTYVGKSAYDVWISEGNSGTKQDFLNSLTGDDGKGLMILGIFNSIAELKIAYPDGSSLKGGFMVDTEYYYWSLNNAWESAGALRGSNGNDGYSPTVTVSSVSDTEYKLKITDKNGDFTTPNLKASAIKTAYTAAAEYSSGKFTLDIPDKPSKLPEIYTITFTAPQNFTKGDKISINGVQHIVNIYDKGYENDSSFFSSFQAAKTGSGYAKFSQTNPAAYIAVQDSYKGVNLLKSAAVYTLVADIKENNITAGKLFLTSVISTDSFNVESVINTASGTGIVKFQVTSKSDLTSTRAMRQFLDINAKGSIKLRTMLIEGDYTASDLPSDYWENTYGVYDIKAYGSDDTLQSNSFVKGQTITLTVGLSGAYFTESKGDDCRLLIGEFSARPTTVSQKTLYLSTDKTTGDADRLTMTADGTAWYQV